MDITEVISGRKLKGQLLNAVVVLLSISIFVLDIYTPLGIADGMLYVAVVMLTLWYNNKNGTLAVILWVIGLIFLGYFFSPPAPETIFSQQVASLCNRVLSIISVIVTSFLVIKYKKHEDVIFNQQIKLVGLTNDLKRVNSELEERIKKRTLLLGEALENLKKSNEKLEGSLKYEKELNELKSRFVSMASHEFRTPLATILSSLSLISKYKEVDDKDKENKHIIRIKSAVIHLTDLVNDVLSVSKLEEGGVMVSKEKFPINDLVFDFVNEMQGIAKKDQKIEYNHSGHNEVILDKKMLRHILLNLVSNAVKFSGENSIVNVKTEVNESNFTLEVKDTGIGISEEDQKHLFQRFFRGSNATAIQGTGLGLNILAKYVELMEGKVDFESRLGHGSTFTVKFPLKDFK